MASAMRAALIGFVGLTLTGVFFSDVPVGVNEGAKGDPAFGDPVLMLDAATVEEFLARQYAPVMRHLEASGGRWPVPDEHPV